MTRMPDLAREAAEAVFHHHHHQPETETPSMTTPAPQQRNLLAEIREIIGSIAANPLIAQLVTERLGEQLAPGDAEHVIALVRSLEGRQAAPVPSLPQRAVEHATDVLPQ